MLKIRAHCPLGGARLVAPAVAPAAGRRRALGATPRPTLTSSAAQPAHRDHDDEIVVTGMRRNAGDVLGGVSVLDQADLTREVRPSIGETLASQPGVSSDQLRPDRLGAGAARPVGRPRAGADRRHRQPRPVLVRARPCGRHQPADRRADRSAARARRLAVRLVGDRRRGQCHRHPHPAPACPTGRSASTRSPPSAARPTSARPTSASMFRSARNFVAHADGSYSKSDDLRTGGHLLSDDLRDEARGQPRSRRSARSPTSRASLPNTAAKTTDVAGGRRLCRRRLERRRCRSAATRRATACRSASRSTRRSRPKRRPSTPARPAATSASKSRSAACSASAGLRGGISNYRHDEIEESGEIGSSFFSKGGELRAELVQAERVGLGRHQRRPISRPQRAHSRARRNSCPTAASSRPGCSPCRRWSAGRCGSRPARGWNSAGSAPKADAVPRHRRRDAQVHDRLGLGRRQATNSPPAGAAACRCRAAPARRRSTNCSPTARTSPASRSSAATATSIPSAACRSKPACAARRGPLHVTANLFYSRFSNFIFQAADRRDRGRSAGLRISPGPRRLLRVRAAGGRQARHARWAIDWGAELVADAVRATIKGFGPAPQIPPFRLLGALTGSSGAVRRPAGGRARVGAESHRAQRNARRPATLWSTRRSTGTRWPTSPS